ncbi:MAG: tryptophan synthase subunit beta [Alphaproteobacteria bacterium GM7ARS4]|nr:tryptophan synthase subunit beta [Alphaproteobacteria bacterium GM7ARS4]
MAHPAYTSPYDQHYPDSHGRFGMFGGRYVSETLMPLILALERVWRETKQDTSFWQEFESYAHDYIGRPSPLYRAQGLERYLKDHGGFKGILYAKREDLNHTGAHKINNCLGQALLARRMGKQRIIAETGAGQHGVATATICALFDVECVIYMGETDMQRQAPNVERMRRLGATIIPVTSGSATLKDALNEALRDWVKNVETTFYMIGSVAGPHPYPMLVRDFQSVIGKETMTQLKDKGHDHPHTIIACVGGGSNAIGIFYPFIDDERVTMIGVEAGGQSDKQGQHAASITMGTKGVLHGSYSYLLQSPEGQIDPVHSLSAGLDYPGVGPEHAFLFEQKRILYRRVTDADALRAFHVTCRYEGIIPALESAHAIAYFLRHAHTHKAHDVVVINMSGRGDKDLPSLRDMDAHPIG